MLFTQAEESLPEAQCLFESETVFDEFLEAEYSLLYLIGTSRVAARMIVEEGERLRGKVLEHPDPRLLLHAFDILKEEIFRAEHRLKSEHFSGIATVVAFQSSFWFPGRADLMDNLRASLDKSDKELDAVWAKGAEINVEVI